MNQNPQLARIENNEDALRDVLYDYFSGVGGQPEPTYNAAASNSQSMRVMNPGGNLGSTTAGMHGGSFNANTGRGGGFLSRAEGAAANNRADDLNDRFDAMDVNDRGLKHGGSAEYST